MTPILFLQEIWQRENDLKKIYIYVPIIKNENRFQCSPTPIFLRSKEIFHTRIHTQVDDEKKKSKINLPLHFVLYKIARQKNYNPPCPISIWPSRHSEKTLSFVKLPYYEFFSLFSFTAFALDELRSSSSAKAYP